MYISVVPALGTPKVPGASTRLVQQACSGFRRHFATWRYFSSNHHSVVVRCKEEVRPHHIEKVSVRFGFALFLLWVRAARAGVAFMLCSCTTAGAVVGASAVPAPQAPSRCALPCYPNPSPTLPPAERHTLRAHCEHTAATMSGFASVKCVLSGDMMVLMGASKGGPPPLRRVTLSNVTAPRLARGPDATDEVRCEVPVCLVARCGPACPCTMWRRE